MIWVVLEGVVLFLLFVFIWSQVVWPALTGRALFPYFKKEQHEKHDQ